MQEAYNVPSFDSSVKKKKSCAPSAPKASAEPYDPYLPEGGRGETAAFREGFQNPTPNYRGMAGDYNYYSKVYGINTPSLSTTEPFQNPSSTPAAPPPQQKCSQSGQRYDYPLSEADKQRYDQAIKTSLSQEQTATAPPPPEKRVANMKDVTGYVDDDLEQYLQTKDMKAAPFVVQPTPVEKRDNITEPYDPDASPFAKALDYFKGQVKPPVTAAASPVERTEEIPKRASSWSQVWDIVIFIFAGIVIMFLCDQIFKLAMLIGMKRTVAMMEPYLLQHESK